GATETIHFSIEAKDLSSFDAETSSWLAESGSYIFKVGSSSKNIKLQDNIEVAEDLIAEKVNKALAPEKEMDLLTK
ncbi:MAG: fibronectin type III-like domain-contianing protein, partial [Prolixibacteraceae bacterium]|nr:fibronectin type III-like domain-contianing protein [Prolixibacteraceae bacterium]